ncbi:hypothetical protein D3C73_1675730 [compost metagenome]
MFTVKVERRVAESFSEQSVHCRGGEAGSVSSSEQSVGWGVQVAGERELGYL